jgi:hypothetical protein
MGMTTESYVLPGNVSASNDQVICTLYEEDYHIGVAVLINSILKAGYRGLFWIGYRGNLPPWTAQLSRRDDGLYKVGETLLAFETVDASRHFSQSKPEFMTSLIERGIARKNLWYFDPDITVRCNWNFFERWIRHGVCLCQEITMGTMASNHPIRLEWMEVARNAGWGEPVNNQERYYNSGFVAMDITNRRFLDMWMAAARLAASAGVEQDKLVSGTRDRSFFTVDQDTMNMTAMYSKAPLTTLGPEGMGFIDGGFAMYHSAGGKKPWRKKFLRSALSGVPPWNGDKHFLECAEGAIRPYTDRQLKKLRSSAKWAALIGRFYKRG